LSTNGAAQDLRSRSMLEMKLLIQFWKRERARLWGIVAFTAVSVAISLAFPYILRYIIDGIQAGLKNAASFKPRELFTYVGILLGFGVLRSTVSVALPYTRGRSNEVFLWKTRNLVFRRVLDMGHSFTNKFPSGDVMERLDQDLSDLSWFACSGVFRPVEAIITLLFALVLLLRMNWLLTVISVLPVSLAVFVWLKLGPLVFKWYREWREKISETNNFLESSFSGIRLVKSYTMEERNARNLRRILNARIFAAIRSVRAEALIGIMWGGISELGILLVLGVGGALVIRQTLTLGQFVAFNAYILMLIQPMFDIGNFFVMGKRAQAAEERVRAMHEFAPDVDIHTGARKPPEPAEVFLTNVGFGYPTTPAAPPVAGEPPADLPVKPSTQPSQALRDINMVLAPGTKIGIAGTVGSGKSTIMRLLLRIAEPSVGEITLNGVKLREFNVQLLRDLYGYAPQEATLFSDTIRNNITLGRDSPGPGVRGQGPGTLTEPGTPSPEPRLREVVRIAQLESELKEMPKGLEETIGERGLKLSGGQKGRVSIARALFNKPKIVLLDDVTASLDAETEQQFIKDVVEYMRDATLVIVSHRLSILAACDIVFVMDKGRIVESGTHTELLEKRGTYWKLYERQIMKEQLETA
jgi:ATP-binding cassette subfamily B multidrug efflux pump